MLTLFSSQNDTQNRSTSLFIMSAWDSLLSNSKYIFLVIGLAYMSAMAMAMESNRKNNGTKDEKNWFGINLGLSLLMIVVSGGKIFMDHR